MPNRDVRDSGGRGNDVRKTDVLIVGTGPTGLVLALWLTKLGIPIRIIDKIAQPGTTSRALAVQARTLELYRQLDLADTVVAHGHKVPGVNLWAKGMHAARIPFEVIGQDLTPYPFPLIYPQDQHERLLIKKLEALGVTVERQTELLSFTEEGTHVTARVRGPNGRETSCTARFLAGCDGARSLVRETIGTGFPGGTYRQVFYVADAEAEGPPADGELHVDLDDSDFLAVFPLSDHGHVRLIGTVRDERADHPETLRFDDVSQQAIDHLQIRVTAVNWFSTYHVHHRVTDHFRRGSAFLLGDAAHIHSPVGGQGMNTGIGDAINLAWKLAAVLTERADVSMLDSYEAERIGFARTLVATTDRAFSMVTAEGRVADLIRTRVAPFLASTLTAFDSVREYLFRTVSQTMIHYRESALSHGAAGHVHGGDRVPWVNVTGRDNYDSLSAMTWQAHVYGSVNEELADWCVRYNVPLQVFGWNAAYEAAGFARDAVYLIRPDSYIALADDAASPDVIEHYAADRGLRLGSA